MTPYRVLVKDANVQLSLDPEWRETYEIYSAMLSKDKVTGARKVYILYKPIPLGYTSLDAKQIAHKMTTTKNSQIMKAYFVESFQGVSGQMKYRVVDPNSYDRREISDPQYTLSDCLIAAMHHYMYESQKVIVSQL